MTLQDEKMQVTLKNTQTSPTWKCSTAVSCVTIQGAGSLLVVHKHKQIWGQGPVIGAALLE